MHARLLACLFLAAPLAAHAADKPFTQDSARAIVADLQKVVSPNGIDQRMEVPINGTKQWITIRGRDRNNPILLFIHGGPAAPEMPTSWTFQNGWEDYFTVVQWDQRGSGKTYNANDPAKIASTITLPQMVSDTEAMVTYLRTTYRKPKIFVLGHSWGSILGLTLAQKHPEWLYAYIGMGQMVDSQASERESYEATLAAARAAHNQAAIKELEAIAPYPEANGAVPLAKIDIERKWSVKFGGLSWNRDSYAYYYHASQLSPDYTNADLAAIDKGSALSLGRLLPQFTSFNFNRVTDFRCPIIIFNGRHDETVSAKVTAAWFARVHAPVKKLVWFENSAHLMQIEEPGRVLVHLVQDVRPLAGK
ncbi:MAG TPA: alpha/beta hydrolase [Rhizomicrobium sp.]|jgi:pimeloyl-ACP methyl ester carboxylesterase|nr:alpha/beta hydrolase [Rhizomicrobium sp.]